MKIERNGMSIELTAEEVEQAYRERLRNYRKDDAADHLEEMFGEEPEDFVSQYGVELDDLLEDDGFLETVVERFEDSQDCNLDENTVWENVIRLVLSELAGN